MSYKPMSIEDYAAFQARNGERLKKIDDIWWIRIRPFFYRPLFPFVDIVPNSVRYPHLSPIGGVQHLIPEGEVGNSTMNFLIYDNIHHYNIDELGYYHRRKLRRGLKKFSVRQILELDELIRDGHAVYLSFYERTHYKYKCDRVDIKRFAAWATNIFSNSNIVVHGAFHEGHLGAVNISYMIQNVIFNGSAFAKTELLDDYVADVMLHSIRTSASQCTGADFIYDGMSHSKTSVDDFKFARGCKLISKPAFYKMGAATELFLSSFMNRYYSKLRGNLK